jgi:hypothetical protein
MEKIMRINTPMAWSLAATFAFLTACGGDESNNPAPEPNNPDVVDIETEGELPNNERPNDVVDPDERPEPVVEQPDEPEPVMTDNEMDDFAAACERSFGEIRDTPAPIACVADGRVYGPETEDVEFEIAKVFFERTWTDMDGRHDTASWINEHSVFGPIPGMTALIYEQFLERDEDGCYLQTHFDLRQWICIPGYPIPHGDEYMIWYQITEGDERPDFDDMGAVWAPVID